MGSLVNRWLEEERKRNRAAMFDRVTWLVKTLGIGIGTSVSAIAHSWATTNCLDRWLSQITGGVFAAGFASIIGYFYFGPRTPSRLQMIAWSVTDSGPTGEREKEAEREAEQRSRTFLALGLATLAGASLATIGCPVSGEFSRTCFGISLVAGISSWALLAIIIRRKAKQG
jgi:hypothetical protein